MAILPNEQNKATPEGACLKGLSYAERAHSDKRLLQPMYRPKPGAAHQPISMKDALDLVAEKLATYRDQYGNKSILFFTGSGMSGLTNEISTRFWDLFGGATTTYGNLCWPAGLEAVRLTMGDIKHNAPWDLCHARLIIFWGKNPAETNIHQMKFVEQAQSAGAKLVVIDPRRTPSSERANLLIQPKPGTDAALALGIAHFLIKEQRIDKQFINKYVAGYESFAEHVKNYPPEKVSALCGVSVANIEKLSRLIAEVRPMTIIPGYGMQRFVNGGQAIRAILSLQVLTGNIGLAGGNFHYANLQSYVFDARKEPESYYPELSDNPRFRREISVAHPGTDILKTKDPELKMIWVERGNPLTQNPETPALLKAYKGLDFRLCIDQFMTDTALESDLVLPAKNMFEQSDIIGSYWNPYVHFKPQILEPPPEVLPETEIYRQLAIRLGFDKNSIEKYLPGPANDDIEQWLEERISSRPDISLDELKKHPVLPADYEEVAYESMKFNTPSGKIELYAEQMRSLWKQNPLPEFIPGPEANSPHPFHLLTPNTKNRIHSQFNNLDLIRQYSPEPVAQIHPSDTKKLQIKNGDKITVYNERGSIRIKVQFDFGIRPGCIAISNGWWAQDGANPNFLSAGRETDIGHGTAFHDCRVSIKN